MPTVFSICWRCSFKAGVAVARSTSSAAAMMSGSAHREVVVVAEVGNGCGRSSGWSWCGLNGGRWCEASKLEKNAPGGTYTFTSANSSVKTCLSSVAPGVGFMEDWCGATCGWAVTWGVDGWVGAGQRWYWPEVVCWAVCGGWMECCAPYGWHAAAPCDSV